MEQRTTRPSGLSSDELRRKKTSFTLDLASSKTPATSHTVASKPKQDVGRDAAVLASPDVGLLALATPDLERFILQQAYGAATATAGATTPPGAAAASIVTTPTQVLFPRSVTEEQEAYARGFLDALMELQRQRQQAAASPMVQVVPDHRATFLLPCASPSDERSASLYTTLTSVPPRTTAVTSAASEMIPVRPLPSLPELIPVVSAAPPLPPPFSGVRPSTLNLSPVARRSAVVPSFDVKRIPPFYDDCETLDLSPSGRYANRTLEHSTAQKPPTSSPTTLSKSSVSQLPVPAPASDSSTTNSVGEVEMKTVNVPVVTINHMLEKPIITISEAPSMETGAHAVAVEGHQEQQPMTMDVTEGSSSGNSTLLMSPIDMSAQEQAKIERKREKNRYAAQKCRMLKLERIDQLQQRVNELKAQNAQLANNASTLCDQVNRLRQMIVEHVEGGCQVMMVHSANT